MAVFVSLSWSKVDNSTDGGWDVERSTDGGSSWTVIATGLSPSKTAYTDGMVSEGTPYTYRVRRYTDHASTYSNTATVPTPAVESAAAVSAVTAAVGDETGIGVEAAAVSASAATGRVFQLPLHRIGMFANGTESKIVNTDGD
jgi:hypothetical protein